MKKGLLVLTILSLTSQTAQAEWVDLSKGLPEAETTFLTVPKGDPQMLFAASSKRIYRHSDSEEGWKQVLSLRGAETRIHALVSDSLASNTIYVATDKGVQKSEDSGRRWKWLYRGIGEKARAVHCLVEDPVDTRSLWLGTAQGLVKMTKDGRTVEPVVSFPETTVYSIEASAERIWLAGTALGIYKSADKGLHWERVFVDRGEERVSEGTELSQFQIEELGTNSYFTNPVFVPSKQQYVIASARGLFGSDTAGTSWQRLPGDPLPTRGVRYLASSSESVYAATDRGIFQWRPGAGTATELSAGLPSSDARMLYYDASSGDLYAATKRGVFRFLKPELKIASDTAQGPQELKGLLGRFDHEPTIQAVQQAAIAYAEVHPGKIEAWRQAAAKKAFLPTFSVGTDMGEDQNVDLDRGGTNDPDQFILGPKEKTMDWHADLSWDLGDLIWNDDQTSIDTRSKLMVELREDILNEVTHLYFERRRLQADMILAPPKELPLQIEKELKLQEITADIDAMTGGYLSQNLNEVTYAERG